MNDITGTVTQQASVSGTVNLVGGLFGTVNVGDRAVRELRFLPFSEFPEVGNVAILYIDTTNDVTYRWDGAMYRSLRAAETEIIVKTTDEWAASPGYMSKSGGFYVYSDYRIEDGVPIPAIKIGDGKAYVVDLPFFSTGVTESDREFWNNKVSAKMSPLDEERLILYTGRE